MTKRISNYVTCYLDVDRVHQGIIYNNIFHLFCREGLAEVEEHLQKITCKNCLQESVHLQSVKIGFYNF